MFMNLKKRDCKGKEVGKNKNEEGKRTLERQRTKGERAEEADLPEREAQKVTSKGT